jgi:TolB-like protein/DNA-binding winged helix-turn-helix (wHTH) protein/Tfp pilus assembly protein PilF
MWQRQTVLPEQMDTHARTSSIYRFGPYHVDIPAGQLRKHGAKIRLAGQPFDILVMLLERAGQVVTREEIQQRLWSGETFVDFENSLNKAINKLRQALADSAEQPTYIETLPRRGYRFIGSIHGSSSEVTPTEISKPRPEPAAGAMGNGLAAQLPPLRAAAPQGEASQAGWRATKSSRWLEYGLGFVALALCVLFLAIRWQKHRLPGPITAVAVLPLEYLSNEPGQEYFADGVTDELITQLAKTGVSRVTSRTSSMQFKKSNKTVQQIASELGVQALVEGSIERVGDRVRIRAQLIRASTDEHLWAESYEGAVSDLLSLEDRVARDIASKVAVSLTPAQRRFVKTRAVNSDAHLDYLRGQYFWNQRTADGFEKALGYFQAAIDKDPDYGAAYAGLADTYLLLGGYDLRSQNEMIPKARAAAQKALEIENLSEAHATLGLIAENYDWDWPGAEKEFRLAIELNPNYSTAHHWYGEAFLAVTGRFDEALAEMKRAAELDPLSPIISTDVGVTLYLARRYDQAIPQLARTLELYPEYLEAQIWLARSYEQKKQCAEAISVLDHNKASLETLLKSEERARIYAECGRQTESLRILDDLQRQASMRFVDPALSGQIFIGLGRRSEALSQLEKSVPIHSTALTSLRVNPIYDPLRSDPRFAALLQTVHLSE